MRNMEIYKLRCLGHQKHIFQLFSCLLIPNTRFELELPGGIRWGGGTNETHLYKCKDNIWKLPKNRLLELYSIFCCQIVEGKFHKNGTEVKTAKWLKKQDRSSLRENWLQTQNYGESLQMGEIKRKNSAIKIDY